MRINPDGDFEPGELMSWQEMSKLLREVVEMCSELTSIFGAEHSDIKTRLDDLEETLGEHITKDLSEEFGVELVPEPGNSGFEDAEVRRIEQIRVGFLRFEGIEPEEWT